MAMVRAACRGYISNHRSLKLSFFCKGMTSSSGQVLPLQADIDDDSYDRKDNAETKAECKGQVVEDDISGDTLMSFLNEQRIFFSELHHILREQRLLLNSIRGELGLQKMESDVKAFRADTLKFSEETSLFIKGKPEADHIVGGNHTPSFSSSESAKTVTDPATEAVSSPVCVDPKISGSKIELGVDVDSNSSHESPEAVFLEHSEKASEQQLVLAPSSTSDNSNSEILSGPETGNGALLERKGGQNTFQHPPWPEWKTLLDNLRPYVVAMGRPSEEPLDDTVILKRSLVKFAQAREGSFRSLSRDDLIELVQHDLPSMDEKTASGKKKLQNYLKSGKDDAKRGSQAKVTDVVRLLYRAVRSMPMLGGALPDGLKRAVINLLNTLNSASIEESKMTDNGTTSCQTSERTYQEMEVLENGICGETLSSGHEISSVNEVNDSVDASESAPNANTDLIFST
ncbi:hypothetical protein KP509_24G030800 [Ceratopteris richardii]|uniref:Uncharacterized protein n=1 Tax=Ceratopteris richardii TaxID=49495 RepID=A0A8T2RTP3_CERRI|nr:hypothetical protein KP509_24G030800 [Ceratopteris richardii]